MVGRWEACGSARRGDRPDGGAADRGRCRGDGAGPIPPADSPNFDQSSGTTVARQADRQPDHPGGRACSPAVSRASRPNTAGSRPARPLTPTLPGSIRDRPRRHVGELPCGADVSCSGCDFVIRRISRGRQGTDHPAGFGNGPAGRRASPRRPAAPRPDSIRRDRTAVFSIRPAAAPATRRGVILQRADTRPRGGGTSCDPRAPGQLARSWLVSRRVHEQGGPPRRRRGKPPQRHLVADAPLRAAQPLPCPAPRPVSVVRPRSALTAWRAPANSTPDYRQPGVRS